MSPDAELSSRDRLVITSAELFRRQGYAATGLKQVVDASGSPFGSIYHFFPGGKEELGAETIRAGGDFFLALLKNHFDDAPDLRTGLIDFFDGAALTLEETDFADACPIATIALEVASTHEALRQATATAFDSWLDEFAARLVQEGLEADAAKRLAAALLSALEGAFVLCRSKRTTEPLADARDMAVLALDSALPT